jgi:hypothetical protein
MTAGQTTNEMTRWKLHMYACAGNTKLARKRGRNTHIKRGHDDPNPTDIPSVSVSSQFALHNLHAYGME